MLGKTTDQYDGEYFITGIEAKMEKSKRVYIQDCF